LLTIVGLGNPGAAYRKTRHNTGFMLLDGIIEGKYIGDARIARHGSEAFLRFGLARSTARRTRLTLEVEGEFGGNRFVLVKPTTFVNESGKAVTSLMTRNVLGDVSELMVVVDDVDLPVGRIRLRAKGSAGGHNGLKSIIGHLGTNEFARLRIGVGPRPGVGGIVDHVLGAFRPEEWETLETALDTASQVVAAWIVGKIEEAQNTYSRLTATN